LTYEYMHESGSYGVTRFDSHAGREVVFLAMLGLGFHEHIPAAEAWLDWLRPVLCGIWPIWARDDGSWAEGPCYSLAYVEIMTMFTAALKHGAGVDMYRRPFWRNHALWRRWCIPPYAEWLGFGDCGLHTGGVIRRNADLVEHIAAETGGRDLYAYVNACRTQAPTGRSRGKTEPAPTPCQYLAATDAEQAAGESAESGPAGRVLRTFPDAGWAAVRTAPERPADDVAFIFRSSPFGAVSHSHPDNNDFILHAGGRVLAMPSGYYCGYGSPHHAHWVWHSKSHNCVTLSGASQRIKSYDSRGAVASPFEDDYLAYFCGVADASYAEAERCRRHVVFVKQSSCFVLFDEFIAAEGSSVSLEWNIHSYAPFEAHESERAFSVERGGSRLSGHFLWHQEAFFSLSEGWDPPPSEQHDVDEWPAQYHLRFTLCSPATERVLGVVLCPEHERLDAPTIVTGLRDGDETARIGDDSVVVQGRRGTGAEQGALAMLTVGGRAYRVTDDGIRCGEGG
jgi:hypothetical protein